MAYEYHDVLGLGDIHRPDDVNFANQTARLAGAGLATKHIGRLIQQTDDGSFWRVTGVGPVTYAAFAPPAPAVGDIGKSLVVESDGASGVRFAYDIGGTLWSRTGTTVTPQNAGDSLSIDGTFTLNSGGSIVTTSNGNITLLPNGTGITIVGDAGSTSHTLNTNDDIFVSGRLEVDGLSYFDGNIVLAGNITTESNANIVLSPHGTGFTVVGSGSSSHALSGEDDLLVSDTLEVNGLTYLDDNLAVSGNLNLSATDSRITLLGSTQTSGDVASIKCSPAASGTASVLKLEADGANWATGARCLEIVTDADSAIPILVNDGASNNLIIFRDGTITTSGDLNLSGGGTIATTSNGDLTLLPNGTGITIVGDAGSTSHGLAANDDLFVSGKLEVDGNVFHDSVTYFASDLIVNNNVDIRLGNAGDSRIDWSTNQTNDSAVWGLGDTSKSILFCDTADRNYDFAHANQTNPTIFVHSANQSANEWLSISHDQTDGVVSSGSGLKLLTGANGDVLINPNGTGVVSILGSGDYTNAIDNSLSMGHETSGDTSWIQSRGTASNTILYLNPNGKPVTIGASATTHGLAALGDLIVSGKLEVDGITYLDSTVNIDGGVVLTSNNSLSNNAPAYGAFIPVNTSQTNFPLMITTGTTSETVLVCQHGDRATDFTAPNYTDPTIRIQSADATSVDQYTAIQHNQTDSKEIIGTGGRVTNHGAPVNLSDDASFDLPDSSAGFGFFIVGDGEEYAQISWTSAAVVTLINNSANVAATDSDTNFCFFDNGTAVRVRNRLGSPKTVTFDYHYTTSP